MKRLLLDHFRRKAWLLALGAAIEFGAGWIGADGKADTAKLHLQVGLFMGPFLLSFDLQRGLGRAVSTLPLCARQIGRAWWFATVAIPAAVYSVLLFAGAGLASLVNPRFQPAWDHLALSSLFLFLWMGAVFPLVTNLLTSSFTQSWHGRFQTLSNVVAGLLIGGSFLFFKELSQHPLRLAGFLAVYLLATVLGWRRAGQILTDNSKARQAAHSGPETARGPRPAHRPGGRGGLSLLVGHTFLKFFPIVLMMVVLQPLFLLLHGHFTSWPKALAESSGVGFFPFWFIAFLTFSPLLLQWRLLRSLPVSTGRLAAGLMLAVLLPVATLGIVHAGFLEITLGSAAALDIANSYLLALAVGAFSLLPLAWLGAGTLSYLLLVGLMILAQFTPLYLRHDSAGTGHALGLTGPLAALAVALAFLLLRHALTHTTRAYRTQANPFTHACAPGR